MKYMMMVMGNDDYQAGRPPSPKLMAAIEALSREARAAHPGGTVNELLTVCTIVNALTPAACARCVRIHNREQRTIGTLRKDLHRLVTPRCAIIGAPIVVPPPRGAEALRQWQRAWTTLDA